MKPSLAKSTPLWIAAGIVLAVGLVMTVRNAVSFEKRSNWIETKAEDSLTIERLASTASADAALKALAAMPADTLERLEAIFADLELEADFEIEYGRTEPLRNGWKIQNASIVFERVAAENLIESITELQSRRPPWRVAGCSLKALPGADGILRATLVLEGIER